MRKLREDRKQRLEKVDKFVKSRGKSQDKLNSFD